MRKDQPRPGTNKGAGDGNQSKDTDCQSSVGKTVDDDMDTAER